MANPVGTFQTYQAIGNREDLSDMIHNISPTETPFVSMAKRVSPNVFSLEAPSAHSRSKVMEYG